MKSEQKVPLGTKGTELTPAPAKEQAGKKPAAKKSASKAPAKKKK
jgi:hypothetical protein